MRLISNTSKTSRLAVSFFLMVTLVFSLSIIGFGQEEDVQTSSEMAKIGYRNVGQVMSGVSGAEVDKKELVSGALSDLFAELASHLDDKNVPDKVVEKFTDRAESLQTLYESGAISSDQLSSEASSIVRSAGRNDPEGEVPVSVLEEAGMEEEEVEELNRKGNKDFDPEGMAKGLLNKERGRTEEKDEEEIEEREEREVSNQADNGDREEEPEAKGKPDSQRKGNNQAEEDSERGQGNQGTAGSEKDEGENEKNSRGRSENSNEDNEPRSANKEEDEEGEEVQGNADPNQPEKQEETGPPEDDQKDKRGKPENADPSDEDEDSDSQGNPGKGKGGK